MSREEFKIFRKRTIGLILATDMARHAADLSSLNTMISEKNIVGEGEFSLFEDQDPSQIFRTQQFLLEGALHCCDIS